MAHHHHHHGSEAGDRRMIWAIGVNLALTLAQIAGGILSGSLSLIADALHNFSDAASLVIAAFARRIARRPSDATMTFGYVRAEVVAALINYTTLIVIGLYLVYEAVMRFITPEPIEGWIVVGVAVVALLIDLVTALLTYTMSKESMNIRAAFVHNVADALGSVGVIIAGTLILLYDWQIVDPIVTLAIAGYILWQAFTEIGGAIRMLMLGTPPEVDVTQLIDRLCGIEGGGRHPPRPRLRHRRAADGNGGSRGGGRGPRRDGGRCQEPSEADRQRGIRHRAFDARTDHWQAMLRGRRGEGHRPPHRAIIGDGWHERPSTLTAVVAASCGAPARRRQSPLPPPLPKGRAP
jgi:cobalt-zinc-cadmium efflux system protein